MSSVVTFDANVRDWESSEIVIDYTITNASLLELILFDVGFASSTGRGDDGLVTLFKTKRDPPTLPTFVLH